MEIVPPEPPINTPLLDDAGRISRAWAEYFQRVTDMLKAQQEALASVLTL